MEPTTSIDPGTLIDGVQSSVTGAVNGNLSDIGLMAGGLIALGVVIRLVGRLVGRRA